MLSSPCSSSDLPLWIPDRVWSPLCLVSPNPFKTELFMKKKEEEAPFACNPILVRLSPPLFSWACSHQGCWWLQMAKSNNQFSISSYLTYRQHLSWLMIPYALKHFLQHLVLKSPHSHRGLCLNFLFWLLLGSPVSYNEVFWSSVLVPLFSI